MKRNLLKPVFVALAMVGTTLSLHVNAEMVQGKSEKTKSIKGYFPSLDSVGTSVLFGDPSQVKVGDIIAIPTDIADTEFFQLKDLDGDMAFLAGEGSYSVAWWAVKPKEGFKWTDDDEANGQNVENWDHVDATLIPQSNYVSMADLKTSKALQIPGNIAGSRIAFSIVPETSLGDPNKGQALYAPDINFFWKNTDENQKPGMPAEGEDNYLKVNGNGLKPVKLGPNSFGGGNTIEKANFAAIIYEDVNKNGVFDPEIDTLLIDYPKVNTDYVVDIKIFKEDGSFRSLTDDEQETIVWDFYIGDDKIEEAGEGLGSFAFRTQIDNDSVSDIIRSASPSKSQQGLSLQVNFSFENEE